MLGGGGGGFFFFKKRIDLSREVDVSRTNSNGGVVRLSQAKSHRGRFARSQFLTLHRFS